MPRRGMTADADYFVKRSHNRRQAGAGCPLILDAVGDLMLYQKVDPYCGTVSRP